MEFGRGVLDVLYRVRVHENTGISESAAPASSSAETASDGKPGGAPVPVPTPVRPSPMKKVWFNKGTKLVVDKVAKL